MIRNLQFQYKRCASFRILQPLSREPHLLESILQRTRLPLLSRLSRLVLSAMEPQEKKACSAKTIGTHNGHFHCDEALACFMLRILPEYKDAK